MYTAIQLTTESRDRLLAQFAPRIPKGWETIADHVTLIGPPAFGKARLPLPPRDSPYMIFVVTLANDDLAVAVGVETNVPSLNFQKHITLATNTLQGGTAFHSNALLNWHPVQGLILQGYIRDLQE